jgi:hypothetical protein
MIALILSGRRMEGMFLKKVRAVSSTYIQPYKKKKKKKRDSMVR